jgi:hypothetical protein
MSFGISSLKWPTFFFHVYKHSTTVHVSYMSVSIACATVRAYEILKPVLYATYIIKSGNTFVYIHRIRRVYIGYM